MKPSNPLKVLNHAGFIADLKATLKAGGYRLKLRPRNKNRKQFYPEKNRKVTWKDGTSFTRKSQYQQDLPLRFATHFAVYTNGMPTVKAVIALYKSKGVNVLYTK